MADFNYDEYKQWLQKPFDPTKMGKGEKWGLALSALASGLTRNQAPVQNFLSSTDYINQQEMAAHQAQMSQYQAQMDAVQHEKQMRMQELQYNDLVNKMKLESETRKSFQDFAKGVLKDKQSERQAKMNEDYTAKKNMMDLTGKAMSYVQKFTKPEGGAGKALGKGKEITGQISAGVQKEQQKKGEEIAEEFKGATEYMTTSPQAFEQGAEWMGIEKPVGEYEKTQRERETQLYNLDYKTAVLNLQKAEQGDRLSITDLTNNLTAIASAGGDPSKFVPTWVDDETKGLLVEAANANGKLYRKEMAARQGGGKKPTEMKIYKSWLDFMGDSKISANDKQDFLSIPTEYFRIGDETGMSNFLQIYSGQSAQFIKETLDRAFNSSSRPMTEAGAAADLRMQGLIYEKSDGMVYDQQGQSYGTLDSMMFSKGYTRDTDIKGNPVYKPQPNILRDTYEANPAQFVQYYQKGEGKPTTPPTPKTEEPKTPLQAGAKRTEQTNKDTIADREARVFMGKLQVFGINEQGLLKQLSTPEGRSELKTKFVDENKKPYSDDIYDLIFKKLASFARRRIYSSESIIG